MRLLPALLLLNMGLLSLPLSSFLLLLLLGSLSIHQCLLVAFLLGMDMRQAYRHKLTLLITLLEHFVAGS